MAIVLASHFNGSNGQQTYTAETGQVFTFYDGAELSTTQKKFGTTSLYLPGDGDYVTIPDNANLTLADNNFTFHFWVYVPEGLGQKSSIWSQFSDSAPYKTHFNIMLNYPNTESVSIFADSDGDAPYWDIISGDPGGDGVGTQGLLTTGEWHHVAVVRNGNNWRTYIDGVKDIDITAAGSVYDSDQVARIGYLFSVDPCWGHYYLDELIIDNGNALWTDDFIPPTSEFSLGWPW